MRVGMIVAQGPGNGHRARCDALRNGLLRRGHDIVGAFDDEMDWLVIDDYGYDGVFHGYGADNIMAIRDDDIDVYHGEFIDVVLRPHRNPEMAWVDKFSFNNHIAFGMSPQGIALKRRLQLKFTKEVLMCRKLVALASPGHSSWERCAARMATLQIIFCESHLAAGKAIEEAGAGTTVWNMLEEGDIDMALLRERVVACLNDDVLYDMGENAKKLCDGMGVKRTIEMMEAAI